MKKLYTLLVSALVAATVTASSPRDISKLGELKLITNDALAKSIIGKKIETVKVNEQVAASKRGMRRINTPIGNEGGGVVLDDVLGEFDCSYSDWSGSNPAQHEGTATLVWSDKFQDIEITLPDNNDDLSADFDELTGSLVFKMVYFGIYQGVYEVYQIALSGDNIVQSVTVPYNKTTSTFEFKETDGIAIVAVDPSSGQIAGLFWDGCAFEIKKSEFDYKLSIEVEDECTPDNVFTFTITAGADIASIKILDMDGDFEAKEAAQYGMFAYGDAMKPGTYSIDMMKLNPDETTPHCFMLAGYNAAGEAVKYAQATVLVIIEDNDNWQTITTTHVYNNEFVAPIYTPEFTPKNIEIQENVNTPGLFRLKNPYSEWEYIHDSDCNHFIVLDVTDPTFVSMPFSVTGLDFGYGVLKIGTFNGALEYTKEECVQKGLAYPTADGRTIKFPVKSLLSHESRYNAPGLWSYGNGKDEFTFTLPDLKLDVTVKDGENKPVADAEVEVEGVKATTGAEGVASLVLPATVDYLATVNVSVTKGDADVTTQDVKLNGVENACEVAMGNAGVDNVAVDAAAAAEYYNLQGVRVDNPTRGQMYIVKTGARATKVIL